MRRFILERVTSASLRHEKHKRLLATRILPYLLPWSPRRVMYSPGAQRFHQVHVTTPHGILYTNRTMSKSKLNPFSYLVLYDLPQAIGHFRVPSPLSITEVHSM